MLPLCEENIAKAASIPKDNGYVAKKPSSKSKTVDPTKWFPPGVRPSADGKGTKCAPNVSMLWSQSDHALYSDNYAGAAGIFGGKGPDCANCLETEPVNITVDITATLNRLGVSRHEIAVVCFVEDPDQDEDAGTRIHTHTHTHTHKCTCTRIYTRTYAERAHRYKYCLLYTSPSPRD